jgi:hypothetical protein
MIRLVLLSIQILSVLNSRSSIWWTDIFINLQRLCLS